MIPDEAVEAAAYALYLDANPGSEVQWFDITFHDQDELIRRVRPILQAAAPHLLRDAWEAGKVAGWDAARGEPEESNPYEEEAEL